MQLDEIISLTDQTPVIAEIHPVSVCYLPDDVVVIETTKELFAQIDMPSSMLPTKMLIVHSDDTHTERFPRVVCGHNPFTLKLNDIILDQYDCIARRMLRQSQIAERITNDIRSSQETEVVILFLVDGLSYYRLTQYIDIEKSRVDVQPCLVDVPTFTSLAFPNIVNDPPLALRLFDMGYQNRLGISYWTRNDNDLTNSLFRTIPQVEKIGDFQHILAVMQSFLAAHREQRVYIQILRTGLDGYVHHQKRQPPIDVIVRQIYQEFESLAELCASLNLITRLYLTSDHGILWRGEFDEVVIGNAPGKASTRWCTWKELYQQNESGKRFVINQQEYYCLGFPKLRRPLHIDEQGVHGGISFQESIVPFVTMRLVNYA